MSMPEHRWPDERWSIFSETTPNPSSPTWCSLSWLRGSDFLDVGMLADRFKRAGDSTVAHLECERREFSADTMFMPIAYLYRHALELKLKQLVELACDAQLIVPSKRLQRLLDEEHNLHRLWSNARKAILARWPDEPDGHVIDNTEALIRDFDRIDRSGQSLRYTRDKDHRPTSEHYPESVDLKDLQAAFDGVFSLLDGCSAEFSEIVGYHREQGARPGAWRDRRRERPTPVETWLEEHDFSAKELLNALFDAGDISIESLGRFADDTGGDGAQQLP